MPHLRAEYSLLCRHCQGLEDLVYVLGMIIAACRGGGTQELDLSGRLKF